MSLLAVGGGGLVGPARNVPYERSLAQPETPRWLPWAGIALGVLTFLLATSVVSQLLIWSFWRAGLIAGSDFATAYATALRFTTPWGMLAVHLGLSTLIPISLGLVAVIHRVQPRWIASVRPWFRWRYLLASAGIAFVVLNAVLFAGAGFVLPAINPQPDFAVFAIIIVLTSPLQAAAEEFFFRGYLMQAIGSVSRRRWLPIVLSALLFAAFHGTQNLPLFLDRFGFGLLAGLLVSLTGGLEAAIAIHLVNNILAFGYAGLTSTIAEVKAVQQVGWSDLARDLISFGLCAILAWLLARRWRVETRTPAASV